MNMYDESHLIGVAKYEDIPLIMEFIEKLWRHNHILGNDRGYFEYEHVIDGKVNFIIARNKETNGLDGILGFLPASKNKSCLDVWTVMWKTRPGCVPLLGLEIMHRAEKLTGCRNLLGIGDNPKTTVPLLRRSDRNIHAYRLSHYYLLAENKTYNIANIIYRPNVVRVNSGEISDTCEIREIEETIDYIDYTNYSVCPYKDEWYIEHRYFMNPKYRYILYGLRRGMHSAIIVMRIQKYNGSNALRIVDYLGDQLCFAGLNFFFHELMRKYNCEYTDFYVFGFDEEQIVKAGFTRIKEDDENIIPDYFNPFVNKNVEIWATGKSYNCMFCKADGDQDRPC